MEYPKFKVAVSCMTYNQAKYITDAMNGFTMQHTSFPFVCTIVDDASTDGEQEVIRKYVEENFNFSEGSVAYEKETEYATITYAQHKTNENCYFAVLYLKENHYSQKKDKNQYLVEWQDGVDYMALCEGDDYWILPNKLERQVVCLEKNTFASFSYTSFLTVDENGREEYRPYFRKCIKRSHSGDVLYDLFTQNFILTLTVIYRTSISKQHTFFDDYNGLKIDYFNFMLWATKGEAIFVDEVSGCYRNNPEGLINTNKGYIDAVIWDIYKYFAIGIIKGKLPRRLSFYLKAKLILHFFIRAIIKFVRNKDKTFLPLLIKTILSE